MIKQILAILLLSILVITTMPYAQHALQFIVSAHDWVAGLLTQVFSGGMAGNLIRKLIALLTIPVGISFIPVCVYWLAKRTWFPYFMELIWIIWLVQTAAIIITYKVVVPA